MQKHFFALLVVLGTITTILSQVNTKVPIIGILANPEPDDSNDLRKSRVNTNYVRWLESAGAEVVVIHPWHTEEELDDILSKVNGVLWQGGSRNLNLDRPFEKVARYILEKVIASNDKNSTLPLWGTCQGFELLHVLLMNKVDLPHFDAYNYPSPLKNVDPNSRMFSLYSRDDIAHIESENITAQFHHLGIAESQYDQYPILKDFFKITSYGEDKEGKTYIASVEGNKYPIYAVQFHPEMPSYAKAKGDAVPRGLYAVKTSQNFANYFVEESRKNNNSMRKENLVKYDHITYESKPVRGVDGWYYFFENRGVSRLKMLSEIYKYHI